MIVSWKLSVAKLSAQAPNSQCTSSYECESEARRLLACCESLSAHALQIYLLAVVASSAFLSTW